MTGNLHLSGGRFVRSKLLTGPSKWTYGLFLAPMGALAGGFAVQLWDRGQGSAALWVWGLGLWAVLTVALRWLGKFPALMMFLGGNMLLTIVLAQTLVTSGRASGWIVAPVVFLTCAFWFFAAVRIGTYWGGLRYRAKAAKGRPILEWEWVYVGRDAALGHPVAQRLGGVHVLAGVLALWILLVIWRLYAGTTGSLALQIWAGIFVLLGALTLGLLYRKHPAAWALVWIFLLLGVPFSIPLMLYWADGRRPNLIYRHRYERLLYPPQTGNTT